MSERGISTLPAVLLAAFAGLVTAVFLADWVIVDVETKNADQIHIVVPFPLVLADFATSLIPTDTFKDAKVPAELAEHREAIMASLECLLACPDATLVKVKNQDTRVLITKKSDTLHIEVDAEGNQVRCAIPVAGIRNALENWDWQTFEPDVLLDALHEADGGPLIKVEAEDARVAISMW
jgi:hypothetical protein